MNFKKTTSQMVLVVFLVVIIIVLYEPFGEKVSYSVWNTTRSSSLSALFNPGSDDLYVVKGNYYLNNEEGNYNLRKAQKMFEKAVQINPDNFEATYNLARTYFLQGEYKISEKLLNDALGIAPSIGRPNYILGLVYTYDGDFEKAANSFEEFIKYAPDEWAGYNDLAWVYLQAGEYENARDASLRGLSAVDENNIWLRTNLGAAYLQLGDAKRALEEFLFVEENFDDVSLSVWRRSYPGNDPLQVEIIRTEFKGLVYFNLAQAHKELGQDELLNGAVEKAKSILPLFSTLRPSLDEL